MLLKLLALAVAVIPVLLFLRNVIFRQPTRSSQGFQKFKRQVDVMVWLFIATVGAIAAITIARMAWMWWSSV